MTVLVDWEIEQLQETDAVIDPFDPKCIQPNSYDLHLGGTFVANIPGEVDVSKPLTYLGTYIPFDADKHAIRPLQFLLATTLETVCMPDDVVGQLNGVSSLARLGISNHQTGGWIDAGFHGQITLELFNCSKNWITLTKGMRIGQLVFQRTEAARKPYRGKYQGQYGATASRLFEDFKNE